MFDRKGSSLTSQGSHLGTSHISMSMAREKEKKIARKEGFIPDYMLTCYIVKYIDMYES